MKKWKQLIALLLIALLSLSGCAGNSELQYDFSIYEDEREFSEKESSEQEEFESFLKDIFVGEMESDPLRVHLSIENPEDYGIEETEMSWGTNPNEWNEKEAVEELEKCSKQLEKFDYDSLNTEQQIVYDILKRYLETETEGWKCEDLASVFSPMSGVQSNIPIILSEYDFRVQEDIDDYILLLETSYEYVKQLCDYERSRLEEGYALTDYSIDKVIEQCQEFIEEEPNCLRPVFEEKINEFSGLTAEEKSSYLEQFDEEMSEKLIPAYELMIDTLSTIKEQGESKNGICNYEGGKEYYEYLVRSETGSARTVDELYQMIEEEMDRAIRGYATAYSVNSNLYEDMENYKYSTEDPQEMMEILVHALEKNFPAAVNKEYELNYVPESLENMMAPAYYLIPPIDNLKRNIIYINQNEEYAHMDLFPTMAHEGFPGHMYQMNYFYSQNPHYFRNLLSFRGYAEGWAQYIETNYAYQYAGVSQNLSKAFSYMTSLNMGLYSMVDIGVNYYGWDYEEVKEFLASYIETDEEVFSEIYYTMIDEPVAYLSYYVGYLEILELKEKATKTLKSDFETKEFHRFLLEIGPCQFDVIEERMEKWMDKVLGEDKN